MDPRLLTLLRHVDTPTVCNAIGVAQGFGMSDALTNGVKRDLGDMDPDSPLVAGSIGPSHG